MYFIVVLLLCFFSKGPLHAHQHKKKPITYHKVLKSTKLEAKGNDFQVPELGSLPYGEDYHFILNYQTIDIPQSPLAYNPSIVKFQDGYILAFRQDDPLTACAALGLVVLDANFSPQGNIHYLRIKESISSEDPKLFFVQDKLFMSYSFLTKPLPNYDCCINLSEISTKTFQILTQTNLKYNLARREKNWTPFTHDGDIYFVYKYNPFSILRLNKPITGALSNVYSTEDKLFTWETIWGELRGGTPAISVGDEYLSFFHSSFVSRKTKWFVFGAITFDKNPPHGLKRISPYPILSKKMYQSSVNPLCKNKKVVYPGGFVKGNFQGKEVFHIVCGENDAHIKLITIDAAKLMNSLTVIP
jgi:predicted GH43/DUF377 family glycosyl hydrolase